MEHLKFEIASERHAVQAADLFLDGKALDRAKAIELFEKEFSICEAFPERRVYFVASNQNALIAYAGARFYDQARDENMYQTSQPLPSGWYLRGLKVHPDCRRSGIARQMTKRRLAWLTERAKAVFVFLNDEAKETIPMYQDFGFKTASKGWEFIDDALKRPDQRGILLQLNFPKD